MIDLGYILTLASGILGGGGVSLALVNFWRSRKERGDTVQDKVVSDLASRLAAVDLERKNNQDKQIADNSQRQTLHDEENSRNRAKMEAMSAINVENRIAMATLTSRLERSEEGQKRCEERDAASHARIDDLEAKLKAKEKEKHAGDGLVNGLTLEVKNLSELLKERVEKIEEQAITITKLALQNGELKNSRRKRAVK